MGSRFGRLDGDVVVTVTRPEPPKATRRIVVGSLREMPAVAPRLAESIVTNETVVHTQGADNLVAPETRRPYLKNGASGAYLGLIAATTSTGGGPSGGFELGVDHRLQRFGIGAHARAGGIGSDREKLSFASIDVGGTLHPWDADTAPFLGSGLVLGYYDADSGGRSRSGSGLGSFAELGVDMLRSSRMGLRASLRADIPFFAPGGRYVVPLTFGFGLAFR